MADVQRHEQGDGTFDGGGLMVGGAVSFSGIGRSTLYELMGRRELPYTKVGARRLIPLRALGDDDPLLDDVDLAGLFYDTFRGVARGWGVRWTR